MIKCICGDIVKQTVKQHYKEVHPDQYKTYFTDLTVGNTHYITLRRKDQSNGKAR